MTNSCSVRPIPSYRHGPLTATDGCQDMRRPASHQCLVSADRGYLLVQNRFRRCARPRASGQFFAGLSRVLGEGALQVGA